jgi:hypothetical protein
VFNKVIEKPSSKLNGVSGDAELVSTDNSVLISANPISKEIDLKINTSITSSFFVFSQLTPSALWTVNHNLGFKPDVSLYTSGGLEFIAEVLHISDNQLTITLQTPISGFARCT